MKRTASPSDEAIKEDDREKLPPMLADATDASQSGHTPKRPRFEETKTAGSEGGQVPQLSTWGTGMPTEHNNSNNSNDYSLRLLASAQAPPAPNLLFNSHSLLQAQLSARYLQEQQQQAAARNAAYAHSMAASNPMGSLTWGPTLESILSVTQPGSMRALQHHALFGAAGHQQQAQLMRSVADLSALGFNVPATTPQGNSNLTALLRRISEANAQPSLPQATGLAVAGPSRIIPQRTEARMPETTTVATPREAGHDSLGGTAQALPPLDEGKVQHYSKRPMCPLGIDEDPNWLSEFHCFVRSELVEVFRASHEDVKTRNNSIVHQQVGIRCRFCAHLTPSARAGRSSAFPSSLRQIYQSFTMMLRDHFGSCDAMPSDTQEMFIALKDKPAQGATDSKRYWIYSAMKIGMTDSSSGIMISERTRAEGAAAHPFGTSANQPWGDEAFKSVPLVLPSDKPLVSEFLFVLMSQVQLVRLTEAERIGNRRSLRLGLPGFGCRYCCQHRRLGLCRMFPARRRTLPSKVSDVYDHIRRCSVCPDSVKEHLERTRHQMGTGFQSDSGSDRDFFDRIWSRLGHGGQA